MGRTIAEKILGSHSWTDAHAGDIVLADVDLVYFHDASRPHPIEVLGELGGRTVFDPRRTIAVIDHYASPSDLVARRQEVVRTFAREHGLRHYDLGDGISHALLPERGHVLPGQLILGGDSHACTLGAVNALSTGMGTTDIAAALLTGKQWFLVPQSVKVALHGKLPPGVYAKDIILSLAGQVKADGATYQSLEFVGDAVGQLSMDARFTISNMAVELGAKFGLFEADPVTRGWLSERASGCYQPVFGDPDAEYERTIECDLSTLAPQVAFPHSVDNVAPLREVEGIPIHQGVLGTCTGGRQEDIRIAASILAGKRVREGVRFFVVPATKRILLSLMADGTLETLLQSGAILGVPGCSGCVGGASFAVPADETNMITTANRNFRGRTGNPKANIYLGSPATVAASVIEGQIADPRRYMG